MLTQHVPAWKRLGLKLKHANEGADLPESPVSSRKVSKKRQQDTSTSGFDDHEHQLKKPRLHAQEKSSQLKKDRHASSKVAEVATPKRKKSVSFTADTKIEDGDSAQTIQFYAPNSPGATPKKTESVVQQSPDDKANGADTIAKPKREKRPKSQDRSSKPLVSRKATAALTYLKQHLDDRRSWKFSKNHETWILKNALSTDAIGLADNYPLAYYIRQTKSAGARQRLTEQSREVLDKQEVESSPNIDDGSDKLLETLEIDHRNQEPETLAWMKSLERPKLILWSLNEGLQKPQPKASSKDQQPLRAKKNKSRTMRVDIDSSSSSSSSSESESESDTTSSDSETDSELGNDSLDRSAAQGSKSDGVDDETSSPGTSSEPTSDDSSSTISDSD